MEMKARTVTVREPVMPREMVYGRTRKGGVIVFLHSTGTKDKDLHWWWCWRRTASNPLGRSILRAKRRLMPSGVAQGRWAGKVAVEKRLGTEDQTPLRDH
jgi:hypothetical protein